MPIKDIFNLHRRLFSQLPWVDGSTFVVWEPCSRSHGEVVPGYARYLLDLGFDVLVLVTPARLSEGLFSRFEVPGLRHAWLSQGQIRKFVRSPEMRKAAGIIVTTAGKLPKQDNKTEDLEKVFGSDQPHRVLLVEHDARTKIDANVWDERYITLRELNYKGCKSTVMNPHYFGNVQVTPKSKDVTHFLLVGATRAKRGSRPLIYDTALKLLEGGESNFRIRIVGKRDTKQIPRELRSHIKSLGRVSFDHLYQEVEEADFILTSFQKENLNHAFYRTAGTSGSFQLAYGFRKPCIVQKQFAEPGVLDEGNCLLYDTDEDILTAMRRATRMSQTDYAKLQLRLEATADELYTSSLKSMERLIHE